MEIPGLKECLKFHKDGTPWAKGQTLNEKEEGFWVWYRKDGTKLRSGNFKNGIPTGEWITYDKKGNVYKTTVMRDAFFVKVSGPAQRALEEMGITSEQELSKYSVKEILEFHGVGLSSIPILEKALREKGLSFKIFKVMTVLVKTCVVCNMPMSSVEDYPAGANVKLVDWCRFCGTKDAMDKYDNRLKGITKLVIKTQGKSEKQALKIAKNLLDNSEAVKSGRMKTGR